MKQKWVGLWWLLLATFMVPAFALPQYQLNDNNLAISVKHYANAVGSASQLAPERFLPDYVLAPSSWQLVAENPLPYVRTGHNWLNFSVTNISGKDAVYYLAIHSSIKEAEQKVYLRYRQPNDIQPSNQQDYQKLQQTAYTANVKVTELSLLAGQHLDVLVYVEAKASHQLPIKLLSADAFVDNITEAQFSYGIAIGGVVALALTLIFMYLANNNQLMLLLAGYFITKALLLSVLLGINLYSFYPQAPQLKGLELPILTAAAMCFLLWFVAKFFELSTTLPTWRQLSRNISWGLLVYMPISVQLPLITNLVLSMAINLLVSLLLVALAWQLIKIKHRLAPLFMVLIVIQLLFYVIDLVWGSQGLNIYGDNLTLYSVSFWLNAFFITFLLSKEHSFQIQAQQAIQEQALQHALSSKQAQEELVALQQNSQELLESKVQERTLELNIVLQELEEANRELEAKNTQDELTGIHNRRFYDQKIVAEYRRSRRNLTPLSLIVIDIDHFKKVNDTYGHLAGDQCIVAVAKALQHCSRRATDMPCRYGGEEFCLILPETDTKGAVILAEQIRAYISSHPVVHNSNTIELTASAGVSTYQQQPEVGTDELFAAADQALYVAKEQGRNQVQQYPIQSPQSV